MSSSPRPTDRDENTAAQDRSEILPLVVSDLTERIEVGTETYGSPLAVESPNDALRFAYEEALDLCLYLRQELERRDGAEVSGSIDYACAACGESVVVPHAAAWPSGCASCGAMPLAVLVRVGGATVAAGRTGL